MKHEIYFDETEAVAVLNFKGDYLENDVPEIKEALYANLKDKEVKQLLVFLAMNNKVENRNTRQKSLEVMIEIGITEVAFVGGSAANRIIAKILLKTGNLKINGDFFKTKEDAFNWLKSKR